MSAVLGVRLQAAAADLFAHPLDHAGSRSLAHCGQRQALNFHINGQLLLLVRLLFAGRGIVLDEDLVVGHTVIVLALVPLGVQVDAGPARRPPFGGGLQQVLNPFAEAEVLRCLPDLMEGHDEYDEDGQQSNDPAHSVGPQRVHIVSILGWFVLHPVEEQNELERGM